MRLRFTASEPLELELDRVESGRHLVYRAVREMIVVGGRRAPLYSFKDAVVQVTASQWLRLEDVSRTGERLSFRVVRDPAVRDAVGPIAWFAHSPMESDGFLPVGSVQFGASDSAAIDVDLTPFVNLRDREALHVEAVSLRDPRHLWAAAVTPTA
jgi:hypothetical protein